MRITESWSSCNTINIRAFLVSKTKNARDTFISARKIETTSWTWLCLYICYPGFVTSRFTTPKRREKLLTTKVTFDRSRAIVLHLLLHSINYFTQTLNQLNYYWATICELIFQFLVVSNEWLYYLFLWRTCSEIRFLHEWGFLFAGSEPCNTDFWREGFRLSRVTENFGILAGDVLEWRRISGFSAENFRIFYVGCRLKRLKYHG